LIRDDLAHLCIREDMDGQDSHEVHEQILRIAGWSKNEETLSTIDTHTDPKQTPSQRVYRFHERKVFLMADPKNNEALI
jgi:hypothetical protein